jgi:hypothetical protein
MEILSRLFEKPTRVRLMRLFLFHPNQQFDVDDVKERTKENKGAIKRELVLLEQVGFLKKKKGAIVIPPKKTKRKVKPKKKKVMKWALDPSFQFAEPLKNLLIDSELLGKDDILNRLRKVGKFKLVVLSGFFTRNDAQSVDLLLVGDRIKRPKLERVVASLESDIGRELRYAFFDTKEFLYRLDMCDKLIRDVFDYSHERLVNSFRGGF